MKRLELERVGVEIDGKFDEDNECRIWSLGQFLNKEEIQQVINHLTLLLEEAK